jgi:hypothetical protein
VQSLGTVAILAYFDYKSQRLIAGLIVATICSHVANFAYSWGPLGWLVPSEIFPDVSRLRRPNLPLSQRLREKGMMLTTLANWVCFLRIECHNLLGTVTEHHASHQP